MLQPPTPSALSSKIICALRAWKDSKEIIQIVSLPPHPPPSIRQAWASCHPQVSAHSSFDGSACIPGHSFSNLEKAPDRYRSTCHVHICDVCISFIPWKDHMIVLFLATTSLVTFLTHPGCKESSLAGASIDIWKKTMLGVSVLETLVQNSTWVDLLYHNKSSGFSSQYNR